MCGHVVGMCSRMQIVHPEVLVNRVFALRVLVRKRWRAERVCGSQ